MNENDRMIISKRIVEHIPENIKPVRYLMDLFKISNESAYRRIRGDMPYSLEEIIRLSKELGFSIDELVNESNSVISFRIPENTPDNRSGAFLAGLEQYEDYLHAMTRNEVREAVMALNHILPTFMTGFDNLFNFSYYKWMHQAGELPANSHFSDIVVPENILDIKSNINRTMQHNKNRTIILSPYAFFNLIKEVEYYYRRKLLTTDERELLKSDLLGLISQTEATLHGEIDKPESEISYYLSSLAIESNNSYVRYDKGEVCYFWVYSLPVIAISNTEVCRMQKKWLDSLKKYSTLVSHSGELVLSEFFRIQRAYIENMDELML